MLLLILLLIISNIDAFISSRSFSKSIIDSKTIPKLIRLYAKRTRSDSESHHYNNNNNKESSSFQSRYKKQLSTLSKNTLITVATITATTQYSKVNAIDCDDSISILKSKEKEIVIIGTAHISEESALLVQRTINELKPEIVMIELDSKRIGKATKESLDTAGFLLPSVYQNSNLLSSDLSDAPSPTIKNKNILSGFSASIAAAAQTAAAAAIGGALKSLYKRLEDLGFSSGAEFKMAVTEGRKIGAKILLGDRNVDLTLNHLAEAVGNTDEKSFNKFVTQIDSMSQKFGITDDLLEASTLPSSSSLLSGKNSQLSSVEIAEKKDKLKSAVENLKQRDLIRGLMGVLKSDMPLVYEALIGERDRFMAQSIAEVDCKSIIAVVGMAHMQGIENTLEKSGDYKVVVRNCPPPQK